MKKAASLIFFLFLFTALSGCGAETADGIFAKMKEKMQEAVKVAQGELSTVKKMEKLQSIAGDMEELRKDFKDLELSPPEKAMEMSSFFKNNRTLVDRFQKMFQQLKQD
jgi:Tfp pilus assembly protein PilP